MSEILTYTTINKRKNNEDCCNAFVIETNKGTYKVLLLADGMGGHAHGELISRELIKSMGEHIAAYIIEKSVLPPEEPGNNTFTHSQLEELLYTSIEKANERILQIISANNWPGGGSTIAGAIITENLCIFANLGDSMIYHWSEKDKNLKTLCNDHSVAGLQYMNGAISEEEALMHPYKNHLVYYVGLDAIPSPNEIKISGNTPIEEGDVILLCSDGVSGKLTLAEMDIAFQNHAKNPEKLLYELIELPRRKKESDNQTLIVFNNKALSESALSSSSITSILPEKP